MPAPDSTDAGSPQVELLRTSDLVIEGRMPWSSNATFLCELHEAGRRPDGGTAFAAVYRVGNGPRGNVGAGALAHVVSGEAAIEAVTNPLAARGGRAPETIEEVRQNAPVAFRTQERAVTPDDYARVAERHPDVQRAAATFRWTGSWHTVFVTADRFGGAAVDTRLEARLRRHLE